jgi:hypothetical protein
MDASMPTVTANGTSCTTRFGSGATLLCIMGASGDGSHLNRPAALHADEFTVVTYDRAATDVVRVRPDGCGLPGRAGR